MITDIDNILLIKYLRNELTDAESQQIVDWVQAKESNKQFLFGLKEAYMLSRWEELRDKAGANDGWSALIQSIDESKPISYKKWMRIGLQYAAAAILLFATGFFLRDVVKQQPQFNTIETASGEHSTLLLSDGTKVTLNENSKLIYPTNFNEGSRKVTLRGEAYFEVTHNKETPFMVNVGIYSVKDIGTKFDVDACSDEIYSYTSLKEGEVQIIDNAKDNKILSELKPGTQLCYNKRTEEYFVKSINIADIADWTKGQVVIQRETLAAVVEKLTQKYGYTFDVRNDNISNLTYNITIENEPLKEILSDIHFITPQVQYSINTERKSVILR